MTPRAINKLPSTPKSKRPKSKFWINYANAPAPPDTGDLPLEFPENPVDMHRHFQQFRIVIMGRANVGKTTLLQRVCNTTEHPEVFDGQGNRINATVVEGCSEQGKNEIENELIFKSNPGFVFHSTSGFEAGSEEEFNDIKKFVTERAITKQLKKRIHAIWFCIPTTDHEQMVTVAEEKFFDECDTVPVIVILTKCDALHGAAINHLENEVFSNEEASKKAGKQAEDMLQKLQADIKQELGKRAFPPTDYLLLAKMNEVNTDCGPLLKTTTTALNEESLKRLLISTQRINLMFCIEYAIKGLCDKTKVDEWEGTLHDKEVLQREILAWFPYYSAEVELLLRWWRKRLLTEERLAAEFRAWGERIDKQLHKTVLQLAAVDTLDVPLVPQASRVSPIQHIFTFGISVILVAEYAYFFMQKMNISSKDAFSFAAQGYYSSGIHIDVQRAIVVVVNENSNDMEQLCDAITKVTMEHRMSNELLN